MSIQSGILIEGMTREEFMAQLNRLHDRITSLEKIVVNDQREEYTLGELARMKGYSKAHLRKIIDRKSIPFDFEGKELTISREDAGKIKPKK